MILSLQVTLWSHQRDLVRCFTSVQSLAITAAFLENLLAHSYGTSQGILVMFYLGIRSTKV